MKRLNIKNIILGFGLASVALTTNGCSIITQSAIPELAKEANLTTKQVCEYHGGVFSDSWVPNRTSCTVDVNKEVTKKFMIFKHLCEISESKFSYTTGTCTTKESPLVDPTMKKEIEFSHNQLDQLFNHIERARIVENQWTQEANSYSTLDTLCMNLNGNYKNNKCNFNPRSPRLTEKVSEYTFKANIVTPIDRETKRLYQEEKDRRYLESQRALKKEQERKNQIETQKPKPKNEVVQEMTEGNYVCVNNTTFEFHSVYIDDISLIIDRIVIDKQGDYIDYALYQGYSNNGRVNIKVLRSHKLKERTNMMINTDTVICRVK